MRLAHPSVSKIRDRGSVSIITITGTFFSILKVLQECIERPGLISTWEAELEAIWPSEVIPALFCHAASCGSLAAVKYFIDCGYKANIRYLMYAGITITSYSLVAISISSILCCLQAWVCEAMCVCILYSNSIGLIPSYIL